MLDYRISHFPFLSIIGTTVSSAVLSPKHNTRNALAARPDESAVQLAIRTSLRPHIHLDVSLQLFTIDLRQTVGIGSLRHKVGIAAFE